MLNNRFIMDNTVFLKIYFIYSGFGAITKVLNIFMN